MQEPVTSRGLRATWLVFLICIVFQPGSSNAADQTRFERNAIAIPTNVYGGFLFDRDGFMWIGTTGLGVYRYDGYELKSFSGAAEGLMVGSMVEDKDGAIWIASLSNGITCYDKKTGLFTKYEHDPNNTNSLSSNNIGFTPQTLCVDTSNKLWVGTDGAGLCEYDKATGTWTRYKHDPADSNSLNNNVVVSIAEGKDAVLWIGTQAGGLNRFDRETEEWTHYAHSPDDPKSLNDNWVCSILEDTDGVLWVGTKKRGLDRLDQETNSFSHFVHNSNDVRSLSSNEVWSLYEDASGGIWACHIVSPSSGLSRLDKHSGVITRYGTDSDNPFTVSSNSISRVFQDRRTGTMWVVNHDGRIDKHDRNTTHIRHWAHDPNNASSLSSRSVLPIVEDSDNRMWVGTMDGGLNRIDQSTGEITRFMPNSQDASSIPRARVTALSEDSSGALWVGFWDGILAEVDRKSGHCVRIFEHDPGDPNSITESERLKFILEDRDDPNILWLATLKGGLDRFDKSRESFTHYKHVTGGNNSLSHNSVITLYDDGNGVLWLPTYGGGLDRFEKGTGTFTNYSHEENNPNSLGSDTLYEVLEMADHTFWVAWKGGISHFDPVTGTFENFDQDEDGLPFGPVCSLLQDDDLKLWLGTIHGGLVRFAPTTRATKRLTVDDGLQGNTFYWTSRFKAQDGTLWFGGSNGISSFHPSQIRENPHAPSVLLTAFTQGGRSIETGTSPERLKSVTLDWRSNYFEFQFAALNFTASERNQYAYMLEGWDEDWHYSGSNPTGRYSGLPGGTYTLRLKGSNNDGVWNDAGTKVTVIVTPPFWNTSTFYFSSAILLGVVVTVIVLYGVKLRRETIGRRQAQQEIIEIQRRETELAEAKLAELIQQLVHQTRLATIGQMTASIAHEIRNPLGAVRNAAYLMKHRLPDDNSQFVPYLTIIDQEVETVDGVIRDMLEMARSKAPNISSFDLSHLIRDIFDRMDANEATRLELISNPEPFPIDADDGQLRQVISNLVTNGVQAIGDSGVVTVELQLDEDQALITVRDDGPGIAAKDRKRLFEPLFTTKAKGTGLGLSICRQIVERHGGTVELQDHEGTGASFCICLPIRHAA